MKPKSHWNDYLPMSLLWACLFFLILWRLDFPKPSVDDLFMSGASLNLAEGGDFSNPLIARQEFPGHYYFLHTPLHSYALAAWLKLFGISASSVTAFQMAIYILAAAATIFILRRHSGPGWLEWLVPFGVSMALLPSGLRHDGFSVALTMTGFALIECGCRRLPAVFLAFLLMFCGGSVTPRLTIFSAALVGMAGYRLWQSSAETGRKRWTFCVPAAGALLATLLLLAWLIDFRLREFYTIFHLHALGRVGTKSHLLDWFLAGQQLTDWPLWMVFAGLLFFCLRKPKDALARIGILIACTFCIVTFSGALSASGNWYMILATFVVAASLSKQVSGLKSFIIGVVICFCLLLGNAKNILEAAGNLTGQISADLGKDRDRALQLRSTPEHPLLVNRDAARYLYDYRLPPGSLSIEHSAPFPAFYVTQAPLHPGDIYVLTGSLALRPFEHDTYLEHYPVEAWSIFGLAKPFFDKYPRRVYIFTAESCKGLRRDQLK